jgi:glycosyltransferase involved in cell wall biosynthesis
MKLALVVPGGVDRSGEYRVIPALLALLMRLAREDEVHVFALAQEPVAGSWNLVGARVHNIGAGSVVARAIAAIRRESRNGRFDVVQSIWSGASGLVAVAAARALRIPSAVHVTGGELAALPEIRYGGRLRWQGRVREALVLRAATAVTAPSEPMIATLATHGIKARRIPLGVDLEAWPLREPVRRETGSPARFIHVASLNRVKDQSTLLHALAALVASGVPFHLDSVGEDTLHGQVQRQAAQLGLADKITFHGFLPQRKLRPLMAAANVNIVSSRHEAGPVAVLEAAALGVPTVGTAVGHLVEWAPDAALCAPIGDAPGLATAIGRLLMDEELRLQLGREAQRRAKRDDADRTAAEFRALHAGLTRCRSGLVS